MKTYVRKTVIITSTLARKSEFAFVMAVAVAALALKPGRLEASPGGLDITVTTTAELAAALTPANAGAKILVKAGIYDLAQALTVPDDATLAGEGVMTFDQSGLPTGFEASGRTVIRGTGALTGNVLTLGNGSTIRSLAIEDVARPPSGNPLAVVSRAAGDFVLARIEECEILNPNPSGITLQGPSGRGLAVVTRNPDLNLDPPPHEGAVLRVRMAHSIIHSPAAGSGVFAINFASHAQIVLDFGWNVIGGGLESIGGVSRPDHVAGARVTVQSAHNLYRSDGVVPAPRGWNVFGGADTPSPLIVSEATTSNSFEIHSQDDAIEGFATGIAAAGARRIGLHSEPCSSNRVSMNVEGLRVATMASDLTLVGAESLVAGVSPGDGNATRVKIRHTQGSGPGLNQYSDATGESGVGNRLEIVGNPIGFGQTNEGIVPPPPAEFFIGGP